MSQSNSIRIAARCCLTVGLAAARCLTVRSPGSDTFSAFQICCDMERLDIDEFVDAVLLEQREERAHGPGIGHPGVVVLDRGGEEVEKAA